MRSRRPWRGPPRTGTPLAIPSSGAGAAGTGRAASPASLSRQKQPNLPDEPLGGEQEVDRLARPVDGAVEVAPRAGDADVGRVDVPRPAAGAQVPAQPPLEFRREALDPAVERDVIH